MSRVRDALSILTGRSLAEKLAKLTAERDVMLAECQSYKGKIAAQATQLDRKVNDLQIERLELLGRVWAAEERLDAYLKGVEREMEDLKARSPEQIEMTRQMHQRFSTLLGEPDLFFWLREHCPEITVMSGPDEEGLCMVRFRVSLGYLKRTAAMFFGGLSVHVDTEVGPACPLTDRTVLSAVELALRALWAQLPKSEAK
jgi:hypothetical protein